MYDPVLSRALFQNPSSTAQGPSAPSAKGTGITSMVTAPDQGAQQLRSFANPTIQPTVRGFADGGMFSPVQYGPGDQGIPESVFQPNFDTPQIVGSEIAGKGFFGGEQLPPTPYGEQGQNPGWGHEGQPMVMSREPVPMGLGPEYQEWAKQHASTSSGGPLEAAVSQATGTTVTAPVDTSAQAPSSRYNFDASKFMQGSVSPTAGVQTPYDIGNRVSENQMRGIASVPQPTGNFYQPSFAELPKYADGGPVQHFQEGGVASMWDNFVNSLTIKEPNRSGNYRLPDVGLRIGQQSDYRKDAGITGGGANYVEPIDIGGPEAVMSDAQRNAVYMRNSASQQAQDPRVAENLRNDEAVRQRQVETRDAGIPAADRIREAVGSGASKATLPRSLTREGPDLLEQQQREMGREADRGAGFRNIGQEPPPPMPGPGFEVDISKPKGAISTHLSDIKAERASQSAADRRENALMALMSAGFGMAAGKSRHALANIAEGGQQGIGTFAQLEKGRREDENRRYLSALHEQEVALRRQDLEARLPLIAAQTKAQESIPAYRERVAAAREASIRESAVVNAAKEFDKIMANPASPEYKAISADKTGTVLPAIKKKLEARHYQIESRKDLVQQNDGLGLRPGNQPSE
jgi:hypothetical protein